jgi:sugar O-acyltransferase (sialic acid O-acetyltransferase NeuD family)
MAKKQKLIIFGTGDLSRLAAASFDDEGKYGLEGFVVDDEFFKSKKIHGLPVFRYSEFKKKFPPSACEVFVGIGYSSMNRGREAKCRELRKLGYKLASYVSPHAICLTEDVGDNLFLFEGVIVQRWVKIGDGLIAWCGATIAHDCNIGDYVFIGPRAAISGFVEIGDRCFIGLNATIKDHVKLADETLVAAGALIVKDTARGSLLQNNAATARAKKSSEVKKI